MFLVSQMRDRIRKLLNLSNLNSGWQFSHYRKCFSPAHKENDTVFVPQLRLQISFLLFEAKDTVRHTETSDAEGAITLIEAFSSKSVRAVHNLSVQGMQVITAIQHLGLKYMVKLQTEFKQQKKKKRQT